MSRHTDIVSIFPHESLPGLPVIDWGRIGQNAPKPISITYEGPQASLPKADIVIITWTTSEWLALDHVFLNSHSFSGHTSRVWEKNWYDYSRNAPQLVQKTSREKLPPLWGRYQLVEINGAKVLLFKSNTHLAHSPWLQGLSHMLDCIIKDASPQQIYSIGTAGGANESQVLGSVILTNSGHISLKKQENTSFAYNNQTFTCKNWYPSQILFEDVQKQLFFPMSNIVTYNELNYLLYKLHKKIEGSSNLTLQDILNGPMTPGELHNPKIIPFTSRPLLTTDYYYIAEESTDTYAVLEMDDAVIAYEAGKQGVDYAFIRNISDPVVPNQTPGGTTIPKGIREEWSSLIYETFGLYTSFNGALTTWAAIAGL